MTDINKKILDLILEGKTTNQIMETLKLSPKQLHTRLETLKNSGYTLTYNVYDNGKIKYDILNAIALPLTNTLTIKLEKDPFEFTALVDSDFHIKDKNTSFERAHLLYDYATKEGINIIFNCGDVIDGCCEGEEPKIALEQVETFVKKHPYDKNIINITTFGNHDFSVLERYGIDISKIICHERSDFISLGFGTSLVNIKNGQIIISHPVKHAKIHPNSRWPRELLERKIILKGHGHHNSIKTSNKKCIIKVPTISDIIHTEYSTIPGALKLTIHLNEDGQFEIVNIESLVFMNGIKTAAFTKHELEGKQKQLTEDKILTRKMKKLF